MGFNFPSTPALGELYPTPAVPGIPVYRWDGEKWTATTADTTAPSPPFESTMAYSGMQINGGMEVSQQWGAGANVTGTNSYIFDGWKHNYAGTMVINSQLYSTTTLIPGFTGFLIVTMTTGQASLGAGDYVTIDQPIEACRTARLAWGMASAQPITIGFWTTHSIAGLYSGSIRNPSFNRSYIFTYTQALSDTPQYNSVTIPGDTAGTWGTTGNLLGLALAFSFGSGSTYIAPSANTWLNGSYIAAPGQVNAIQTGTAGRITGVTVIPGTQAPTASQSANIMRPYGQEVAICQRYYYRLASGTFVGMTLYPRDTGTDSYRMVTGPFPVAMRVTPTCTARGLINYAGDYAFNANAGYLAWEVSVDTGNGNYNAVLQTLTADARF